MPVQCTCRQCGGAFSVSPSVVAKQGGGWYCSKACHDAARRKRPSSAVCEGCGLTFAPQPKTAGRFCSATCAGNAPQQVEITCQVCGKTRWVKPSVVAKGHGRYCSTVCSSPLARKYDEQRFWREFWAKTRREGKCLIWTGQRRWDRSGEYGKVWVGPRQSRKRRGPHQLVLEKKLGRPVREGFQANHTCDRMLCVEESHLYEGTQQQNMDDMYARGRGNKARGSRSGMSKLTETQVREIKLALAEGVKQAALAARYDVTFQLISEIKRGKIWTHVIV